jgi:hypothetical protein
MSFCFPFAAGIIANSAHDVKAVCVGGSDRPAGSSLAWNLTDARGQAVSPGVYIVRLTTAQGTTAQTLVVK